MYLTPQTYTINHYPPHWGQILTPSSRARRPSPLRLWAGDNEAFTKRFQWPRFYTWLKAFTPYKNECLFITVPDVVCDPIATREQFDHYSPIIRELGYPVAFVAQDGQEQMTWPEFDALFIGGSTEWKLSTATDQCIQYAISKRKWVHIGRVNSQRRIKHFQVIGANSVDGTTICYAPDKKFKVLNRQLLQKPLFTMKWRNNV